MVSKIKSRGWLGITIIPESRNSLGAKVPCYDLVGTIQRLCAYSKAMISQGTKGTSILNMQKQQKIHSFIQNCLLPCSLPSPWAFLTSLILKLEDEKWSKLNHFHHHHQAYNIHLKKGVYCLHFETQPLKNIN